jgi:hypothetical protein
MSTTALDIKTVKRELDDINGELKTLYTKYSNILDKILKTSGCQDKFINASPATNRTPSAMPSSPTISSNCATLIDKHNDMMKYILKKEAEKKRILVAISKYVFLKPKSKTRSITSRMRSPVSTSGKTQRNY